MKVIWQAFLAFLCTSAYGFIFLCIVVWDCRQNGVIWGGIFWWCLFCYESTQVICDHLGIRVRTNKIYLYGKMQVICDHLNVHICTNKRYKERAVFSYTIWMGVRSTTACIGHFHHYNLTFLLLLKIYVIGSMKMIQEKKFIVLCEAGSNGTIHDISETFLVMRIRV